MPRHANDTHYPGGCVRTSPFTPYLVREHESTLLITHGWDASQPRAPMVHHAWTPGMFWSIFNTALQRQANSGLSCAPKSLDEHTFGNEQEWDAPQQRAPVVHHAWTPGMFWSNLCTALKREATSPSRSAATPLDGHKLGNAHGL